MMAANTLLIRPRSGRTVPLSSYVLAVLWGAYSCRLFRIDYPLNFCWSWPNWSWHCQIPCSVFGDGEILDQRHLAAGSARHLKRCENLIGSETRVRVRLWMPFDDSWLMTWSEQQQVPTWSHMTSSAETRVDEKKEEQRVSWPPLIEAKGVIEAEPQGGTNRLIMDHASN